MVAFFGILVIPLGLTHILLVISQPVVVHAWCTFCLLAAVIMLPMIPLEVDEVVAMCQHLSQARRRGDRNGSTWAIFWKGGKSDGCEPDERSPKLVSLSDRPLEVIRSGLFGMSATWPLSLSALAGVALMVLPATFGVSIQTRSADVLHLGGALIATVSVISMGEVLRIGRYINIALGGAVVLGSWLFNQSLSMALAGSALGVLVIAASPVRGHILEKYGSWDSAIR
jgi:hypothetical protein